MEGKVAIGLIQSEGKYLVTKRSEETSSSGYWAFPGGKIEQEENVQEAALREVKEETGLEPEVIRTGESYLNSGELGEWMIFPVLMESEVREVDMNHEHSEYRWIDLERIDDLDTLGELKAPEKLDLR